MDLLTVKEAAERLGRVSEKTVYKLCTDRKLAHFRIGAGRGVIRISEEDLEAYRQSCKVAQYSGRMNLKHIRPRAADWLSGIKIASRGTPRTS
jgi:excisionase family DNA binding protein